MATFTAGSTIVVRHMVWGKPFMVYPQRVIADTGSELTTVLWPGVQGHSPELWARSMHGADPAARDKLGESFAKKAWEMAEWTWRRTVRASVMWTDRHFAVDPMWDDTTGELICWYVNFQVPFQRSAIGVDTRDLDLDLVVAPDLNYRWKDEDEYAQARRLGLITDGCHQQVELAREQVVGMVEQEDGPFGQTWPDWRRDPSWPMPLLPAGAFDEPTSLPDLPG